MFNMAIVHKDKGDYGTASRMFEQSLSIFEDLRAQPCIALVKLNQGTIQVQRGRYDEAEALMHEALASLENMAAMPDLCEGYLAAARLKLCVGQQTEARFYLSEAETIIHHTDYQPMKIQLYNAWGEFFQAEKDYDSADGNYEKALALARMLCHPLEEAKALRNQGMLALAIGDYRESENRLQQALAAFGRLCAIYDVVSLYDDLSALYLAQKNYALAEEMAALLERQSRLLGYTELNIKAFIALADCEAHTGRGERAAEDYAQALRLAKEHSDALYLRTTQLLSRKVIDFLEATSLAEAMRFRSEDSLSPLRAELQKGEYGDLLEKLSLALESRKSC
jgi:tetratricopeptide (TPR) repeat protein